MGRGKTESNHLYHHLSHIDTQRQFGEINKPIAETIFLVCVYLFIMFPKTEREKNTMQKKYKQNKRQNEYRNR